MSRSSGLAVESTKALVRFEATQGPGAKGPNECPIAWKGVARAVRPCISRSGSGSRSHVDLPAGTGSAIAKP
jgi:hypothetical protein